MEDGMIRSKPRCADDFLFCPRCDDPSLLVPTGRDKAKKFRRISKERPHDTSSYSWR